MGPSLGRGLRERRAVRLPDHGSDCTKIRYAWAQADYGNIVQVYWNDGTH